MAGTLSTNVLMHPGWTAAGATMIATIATREQADARQRGDPTVAGLGQDVAGDEQHADPDDHTSARGERAGERRTRTEPAARQEPATSRDRDGSL